MTRTAAINLADCWDLYSAVNLVADAPDRLLVPLAERLALALDHTAHLPAANPAGLHVATGKPDSRPPTGTSRTVGDEWRDRFTHAIANNRLPQALIQAWVELDQIRHAPQGRTADQSGDERDVHILNEYRGYDPHTAAAAESVRGHITAGAIRKLRRRNDCDPDSGHDILLKPQAKDMVLTLLRTDPGATNSTIGKSIGKCSRTVQRYRRELEQDGLIDRHDDEGQMAA